MPDTLILSSCRPDHFRGHATPSVAAVELQTMRGIIHPFWALWHKPVDSGIVGRRGAIRLDPICQLLLTLTMHVIGRT